MAMGYAEHQPLVPEPDAQCLWCLCRLPVGCLTTERQCMVCWLAPGGLWPRAADQMRLCALLRSAAQQAVMNRELLALLRAQEAELEATRARETRVRRELAEAEQECKRLTRARRRRVRA